jgi:bifunctional non-homologous end joining protein LigD
MADRKNWLLIKHKDRFVGTTDLTALDRSVLSGVNLENVKAVRVQRMAAEQLVAHGEPEALPASLAPMHAELGDAAFDHADWMWDRSSTATARSPLSATRG